MKEVSINREYIKLGQLLKLTGSADSGIHAKIMILDGVVKVNGEIEIKRGKKIVPGDIVEIQENEKFKIIAE